MAICVFVSNTIRINLTWTETQIYHYLSLMHIPIQWCSCEKTPVPVRYLLSSPCIVGCRSRSCCNGHLPVVLLMPAPCRGKESRLYRQLRRQTTGLRLRPAEEREVLLHKTGDDNDLTAADRHPTPVYHDDGTASGPHNLPVGLFLLHA